MIKMIVCADIQGGIGFNNDLIYNISEDMKFFRDTTFNQKIVMGYNTWLSLPKKPLPNRENYVLCYNEEAEGAIILNDLEDVVKMAENDDIIIIGGAMIYNLFIRMDLIDEAYVTIVNDIHHSADKHIDLFELEKNLKHRELIKDISFIQYHREIQAHIYKYTR